MNKQISDVFHMTYLVITPPSPPKLQMFGRCSKQPRAEVLVMSMCTKNRSVRETQDAVEVTPAWRGGLTGSVRENREAAARWPAGEPQNEWQEVMTGKHDKVTTRNFQFFSIPEAHLERRCSTCPSQRLSPTFFFSFFCFPVQNTAS